MARETFSTSMVDRFKSSWFLSVRGICLQYSLLILLRLLPAHLNYTHTGRWQASKQKVPDFLNTKLRSEVLKLESLSMFRAEFMSLSHPHPIWTSAGSSPFEVKKATVQARMLSGKYRISTCWLRRHWYGDQSDICKARYHSGLGKWRVFRSGFCSYKSCLFV